mgnify:CR=1 FL=1
MLKRFKDLCNKQLSKIENFDNKNAEQKSDINKYMNDFSRNLETKIKSSENRINFIRKSIQNTKL